MKTGMARTTTDIARCFFVMAQLHPHLREDTFVEKVTRMTDTGYALAFLEDAGLIRTVAGLRIIEMLSPGPYLVIEDLVTDAGVRSQGYGSALFDWLVTYAREHGCRQVHLDSGVRLSEAHRFYFRKQMYVQGFHFVLKLGVE
jgi:GNAT superfamily N-acetyltransferase